jgi:hypothetical protein
VRERHLRTTLGGLGVQGFVESDWVFGTRSTVAAANAGLDIEMPVPIYFGDQLTQAVNNGDVSQATIDGAVRRILRAQICFRLDTVHRWIRARSRPRPTGLTRDVAREAIVLKNAGRRCRSTAALSGRSWWSVTWRRPRTSATSVAARSCPPCRSRHWPASRRRPAAPLVTHVPGPTFSAGDQSTIAAAEWSWSSPARLPDEGEGR